MEQEILDEAKQVNAERDEQNIVTSKSLRQAEVPSKYKDYIYDIILGKRSTTSTMDSTYAVVEHIRRTREFDEEYLSYLRIREPLHYKEAARGEDWIQAMQEELSALDNNNTWEMTH